mmetsp:Transcript_36467/g.87934  ORF Transcript_36467/g.87934 Transcript_36467/m.87934 type:complete len:249 (-) Transcript_36467:357-1103(-)
MRAIEVDHAGHPALGYIIGSRTAIGLKEEYRHLDGARLRDLAKSGVSIKADPIDNIEIAYTGDTCAHGLMKPSTDAGGCKQTAYDGELVIVRQKAAFDAGQLFQAELLLCELTFLDPSEDEDERSKASERGHLHINDIESVFSSHDQFWEGRADVTTERSIGNGEIKAIRPKSVVFYHLSAKYQPALRALDCIGAGLPHQLRDRCHVAISSMLSQDEKSSDNSITKLIQPNGCIPLAAYTSSKDNPTT